MRILVTGKEGQVVRSLLEKAAHRRDIEIVALGRPQLDLAEPHTVNAAVSSVEPDLVVSAAAYTAVDKAEDEPEGAHSVNATGARAVAEASAKCGVPIIHLSTDYVFPGEGDRPYTEEDATGPQCTYGRSKLEGEKMVAAANPQHIILRTAWVYSPFGKNFVKTMLNLADSRESISVVSDQWGNPTSALDIADAILHLADRLAAGPDFSTYGVFHMAGTGDTNWSGFARTIFEESRKRGGPFANVMDIVTSEYPTKAERPLNSRLSTEKFEKIFGWRAPHWKSSTESVVHRVVTGL